VNRGERLARRFDSWQQRNPPMAFAVAVMKKLATIKQATRWRC
jgi:hypothetical protein